MATLEKIRKRSVLLFTIIIVALLAFILGDFLNSGRSFFSDPTTASKVDGHKIDIQELNNRVTQIKQQNQSLDDGAVREQVLSDMISEVLFDEELDKIGIVVTDEELTAYIFPENDADTKAQREQVYDATQNPAKYGIDEQQAAQLKAQWQQFEKNAELELKQIKYAQLLQNTLVPNKLDLAAERELLTHNTKARVVSLSTASLEDDDYPVSDKEIEAEYEKFQSSPSFQLAEPSRAIDFIAVDVTPSEADYTAAADEVNAAVAKLKEDTETQAVNSNYNFHVERAQLTPQEIQQQIGQMQQMMFQAAQQRQRVPAEYSATMGAFAALDTLPVGQVWESGLNDNNYTIAKMIAHNEIKSDSDTIVKYDFAIISYTVEPSTATRDEIKQKIAEFAKANSTPADMEKNAADAGYNLQHAYITPSSFTIQGLPDSFNAAHWAVKAEKDQVSPVFSTQQDNRFMVVAVKDIYEGDLMPVTDEKVRDFMTQRIRSRKKAESLADQYAGQADNIDGYAQLMGATVTDTDINIRNPYGMKVLGAAAAAENGALVGPLAGNGQVVVFEVVESGVSETPMTEEQLRDQYKQRIGGTAVASRIPGILRHNKKIETRVHDLMGEQE